MHADSSCHPPTRLITRIMTSSSSSSREIILAGSPEGPITAYDADTGTPLASFSSGGLSPCKSLTLAGKTLIATSHISATTTSGSICLYNWCSSTAFRHFPIPEPVAPLAATPNGLYLFSGGLSGQIHALSLPSGDLMRSFTVHYRSVTCLAINDEDDGSLLISGGDDGVVAVIPILRLLDAAATSTSSSEDVSAASQLALYHFPAHSSSITAVAISAGGCNSIIVSSSLDCTCKFWSLAHGALMHTIQFPCVIWCLAMDSTVTEFYAGGSDGKVYVGMMKTVARRRKQSRNRDGKDDDDPEVKTWAQEHSGAVTALAIANQGRCLVSASEDGSIRMWETESGRVIRVLGQDHTGAISNLVVAKRIGSRNSSVAFATNDRAILQQGDFLGGLSARELGRWSVREVREMEECLNVAVKDRRRAVDTLEAAIGTYERLLTLLLNEAKGGSSKEKRQ